MDVIMDGPSTSRVSSKEKPYIRYYQGGGMAIGFYQELTEMEKQVPFVRIRQGYSPPSTARERKER